MQRAIGHRLGEARAKVVLGHADSRERTKQWQHAFAIFEQCGAKREATATIDLLRRSTAEALE
jgi:hypothetical protein